MNLRALLTMLITFAFVIASCGTQVTPVPTLAPTQTLTPIPPSNTPTLTPTLTPSPTSTPTFTPTPIGGKGGLLLHQIACDQNGNCEHKIFLYNLVSHELIPFLEGYVPLDISPDGKMVLLIKSTKPMGFENGDLFILDLAQPEKMTLLQERVEDAVWLGDSGWIGLIKVNGKRQGFILHPDGSELTQVTKSSVGVVELEPVFNDGIFWSEGTGRTTQGTYWTKLDGTQTKFTNFVAVAPDGKYVITNSKSGPGFELVDVATGETKEISLSKSDPNINFVLGGFRLLSEDKWLIVSHSPTLNSSEYWIYSSDGTPLTKFPNEYRIVNPSSPPQTYDLLSSDGVWIIASQYEKISDEQSKTTYYLFNTTTSEIKDISNLYAIETGTKVVGNRLVTGDIEGCRIFRYFWVEIP